MKGLELRIPPPVVALLAGIAMWFIARSTLPLGIPRSISLLAAGTLAAIGVGFALAGILVFRKAGTTIHPHKPQETSALVTSGIYRVTRNPMYVGLTAVLVAWAVFLSSAWALIAVAIFVAYISRFQIRPEERILSAKFGEAYAAYKSQVRRWF